MTKDETVANHPPSVIQFLPYAKTISTTNQQRCPVTTERERENINVTSPRRFKGKNSTRNHQHLINGELKDLISID